MMATTMAMTTFVVDDYGGDAGAGAAGAGGAGGSGGGGGRRHGP